MTEKVVVLGGGVAGMTAAHELQERGFEVVVYERNRELGGKARSFFVPERVETVGALPAEHGFRFLPGFYKHLTETLSRIPYPKLGDANDRVIQNLVNVERAAYAQKQKPFFKFPTDLPSTLGGWKNLITEIFSNPGLGVPFNEAAFAAFKLLDAMTMCAERREQELDGQSWWDYMRAEDMSPEYRSVVVNGLTQNFVAMDAKESSTKSVINILARLLSDLMPGGFSMDRILNGPTSEVWIDPWERYLAEERQGEVPVRFEKNNAVDQVLFDGNANRVTAVRLRNGGEEKADYYVAAVPIEAFVDILDKSDPAIKEYAPSLKALDLDVLQVRWMSGIMYYLKHDDTMDTGHVVYLDSEWALTSISQNQFWRKKMNEYGSGSVDGILSVIVSDWDATSSEIGKTAQETDNAKELADGALAQIRRHRITEASREGDNIVGFYVDPALQFVGESVHRRRIRGLMPAHEFARNLQSVAEKIGLNLEPLFINTINSWQARPRARTEITNLFLAADYVRTETDLATMEGANEAARRAVNGILDHMNSRARRCRLFSFDEPSIFAPMRCFDKWRFDRGLPRLGTFQGLGFVAWKLGASLARLRR